MKRTTFNKRIVGLIRFIYRVGVMQSVFFIFGFISPEEEYSVKWKGRQVFLRRGTSDFHVYKQVLVFHQYDNRKLRNSPVKTVVDLGANIGLSTLFLKKCYPEAMVIAVEPDLGNFKQLEKNVSGFTNVYCLNNAIWSSNKTVELHDTGNGAYGFMIRNIEIGNEKNVVRSITMDDIINLYKIEKVDLLKVDIEGSETELFGYESKSWLTKVGCIVIELHDWLKPGCSSTFFNSLAGMEYEMSFKGENVTILFSDKSQSA
jgi:FkbM family methyltransferase